jgi:hypothetical protein
MAHHVTAADVTLVTAWTAHVGDDPFGKLIKKGHAPMVDTANPDRPGSRIAPSGTPQTISRARAVSSR